MRDITEKLDMYLQEGPLYGKPKSKAWKDWREKVLTAKNKRELEKFLQQISKEGEKGKLSPAEVMDLVDKVDQKAVNLAKGGR